MKTFKDFKAFTKRISKRIDWSDYFKLGGRLWEIYEYGGGSMMKMDYDYVYFINRRSNDLICVKYDCPNYQWIDGQEIQTKKYRFIDAEYLENAYLWR